MPAVPDFVSTEQYGFTPDSPTSPGADSAAATALLQGGDNLANAADDLSNRLEMHFAAVRQQQQRTEQMVQASSIESQGAVDLANMRLASLKNPDYINAGPNFMQQAASYKQDTLSKIQDPAVQAYVGQALDKHITANGISVYQDAFKNGNEQQLAGIGNNVDSLTLTASQAANPADLDASINALHASIQGGVAGQLLTPLQARTMTSNALRQAITLRSSTDPSGAQAMLQHYGNLLTGLDMVAATERLQPLLNRQAARAGGADAFNAATGQAGGSSSIADAIHGQESGGAANSATSVNGAQGGWQITPGTFAQYAQPGESIGNPADNDRVGRRIVDDLSTRFGGDPARVAVAYFSGPGNVAPAGSATPWLADKADGNGTKVSSYVQGVLGRMPAESDAAAAPVSSGPSYPNDEKAAAAIGALPEEQQAGAWSAYKQQANRYIAGQSQQRAAMDQRLTDVQAGLQSGLDVDVPTESDIRRLYPAGKADGIVQRLGDLQQFGLIRQSVDLASPAELQQDRQDLANGTGLLPRLLAAKGGAPLGDQAAAPDSPPDLAGLAARLKQQALFEAVVKRRQDDLTADPAAYVATRDPTVTAARQAIDPNNPQTFEAYAAAALAAQKRLGVADSDTRVLGTGQAQAQAKQLTSADPSTTDAGAQLDALAQSYGNAWPSAWHDLVRDGKMPDDWQVLAQMPAGPDRITMQRALQASLAKGGLEGMRSNISKADGQAIDNGLDSDPNFSSFAKTLMIPGVASNPDLLAATRNAIRTSATYRALNQTDGATALSQASAAALPYDYEGLARAPQGQGALAASAAASLLQGLKPGDLADAAGGAGMAPADRQSAYLSGLRRAGTWVTNERGDGWTLVARGNNGAYQFPTRPDGSRIGFKFADMASMPITTQIGGVDPDNANMVLP